MQNFHIKNKWNKQADKYKSYSIPNQNTEIPEKDTKLKGVRSTLKGNEISKILDHYERVSKYDVSEVCIFTLKFRLLNPINIIHFSSQNPDIDVSSFSIIKNIS